MQHRTRQEIVQFRRPFQLRGEPKPCAAGAWVVRTEEELLEGLSFPAWRRTATTISQHNPPSGTTVCALPVDPDELAAVRAIDEAAT